MDSVEFTVLLRNWQDGDKQALDELTPAVYQELHRIAASFLRRERSGHTLQATALIHEAYVRLVDHKQREWHSRAHFFFVASHIMRQILATYARARKAEKRGGGVQAVPLDESIQLSGPGAAFTELDEALSELQRFDPRKARLMELKYFGGLTGEETAEVMEISVSTVTRECRLAEAWLKDYLTRKNS